MINKIYKVKKNIWYKGKIIPKEFQLELSKKDAKEYLEIKAIEEIIIKEQEKEREKEKGKEEEEK
jgi:hypothetical protein